MNWIQNEWEKIKDWIDQENGILNKKIETKVNIKINILSVIKLKNNYIESCNWSVYKNHTT